MILENKRMIDILRFGMETREFFNEHELHYTFNDDILEFRFNTVNVYFDTRRCVLRMHLYKKTKNKRKFIKSLESPPMILKMNENYSLIVKDHPEAKKLNFNECELQIIFEEINLRVVPETSYVTMNEKGKTILRTQSPTQLSRIIDLSLNVYYHEHETKSFNDGMVFYKDTPEEVKIEYLKYITQRSKT